MKQEMGLISAIGITGGAWVILASLFYVGQLLKKKNSLIIPGSVLAMTLAHAGLGVFLIGLSVTSSLSSEKHLRMEVGDKYEMSGYTFEFTGISQRTDQFTGVFESIRMRRETGGSFGRIPPQRDDVSYPGCRKIGCNLQRFGAGCIDTCQMRRNVQPRGVV